MIILAIVLFIVFVIMLVVGIITTNSGKRAKKVATDSWERKNAQKTIKSGKLIKILSLIPIIILLPIALLNSIYIIDAVEIGVVKTFGQIHRTIDAGLNFVNPLTDTIEIYDLRVHVKEAQFMSYSKDIQPFTTTVETQFKIMPSKIEEIAKEYGSQDTMEAKLSNIIEERAKIVFAKYSAIELIANRANLSAEVKNEITNIEKMFGIEFTSVIVKDIDFSDTFEQSIEARLAAQGEADALKIIQDALASMPEAYIKQIWIEKWNGKLPAVTSDETDLMLTPGLTN